MNHDEIIAMAREAGMEVHEIKRQIRIGSAVLTGCDSTDEIMRFAALVAAAEREACAQVCASEEARALYNFDNDLGINRNFWNGGSEIASSCAASITARGNP